MHASVRLTKEVHHEAVVVAVDVGGRVGLELHGDVGHGSEQLEVRPRAAVLTQDVRRQVVPVVEGQEVVLPQVQSGASRETMGPRLNIKTRKRSKDCAYTALFLTSGRSKRCTTLPHIHPFMHTFTHRRRSQPRRATASSSGAVRVRWLPLGALGGLEAG